MRRMYLDMRAGVLYAESHKPISPRMGEITVDKTQLLFNVIESSSNQVDTKIFLSLEHLAPIVLWLQMTDCFQFIGYIPCIFPAMLKRLHGWQPRRKLYVYLTLAPVLWVKLKFLGRGRKWGIASFLKGKLSSAELFKCGVEKAVRETVCSMSTDGYSWDNQTACLQCGGDSNLSSGENRREPFLRMQRRLQYLFQSTKLLSVASLGRTWRENTQPAKNIGWDWFFFMLLTSSRSDVLYFLLYLLQLLCANVTNNIRLWRLFIAYVRESVKGR